MWNVILMLLKQPGYQESYHKQNGSWCVLSGLCLNEIGPNSTWPHVNYDHEYMIDIPNKCPKVSRTNLTDCVSIKVRQS